MRYERVNFWMGWIVFAVALTVYLLTVAPTVSFWDCGEFIACAHELEVPHPPGAPFYLLIGRLFAFFAPSLDKVAYMVNLVSVFAAAFTVMLTFWITTYLGKKALLKDQEPNKAQTIVLMFAGVVGAFSCMFATSFWFNAVEAEVYASSSFFTALVIWLMLKWEQNADKPDSFRWLLLICYMIGLSLGVHLLNLLTIPGLALIYYFRRYPFSWTGAILAFVIGAAILAFIQFGVLQYTFRIAWFFEKFFTGVEDIHTGEVTGLGLPFGTGFAIWLLLLAGILIGIIYYGYKKKDVVINTVGWGILLIYLGFSSYSIIWIRSAANPPIDENNPEHVLSFLYYMRREQYGQAPLIKGPMYNSQVIDIKDAEPNYLKLPGKKRYIQDGYKKRPVYARERFFPRMWSQELRHYTAPYPHGYKNYVSNLGSDPNNPMDDRPTGLDNLKFFFTYQIYHMYIRYFLWNFVGREGELQDSDWESGLNFAKLSAMPDWMRNEPSRNHYYFLPLLLGLIGATWHFYRHKKDASVVLILFFFLGAAILIYLNITPLQPRERDYTFAGSFQVFAIWIGIGVLALFEELRNYLKNEVLTAWVAGVTAFLAVPVLMGAQNWDDHDRSRRYIAADSAYNLLNSCAKNAILFTNGDNDTFPLWYLQEVEGVRTDVRIVNLSLLNTDWYIYQLKHQYCNDAPPAPISADESFYMGEKNSVVYWKERTITLPVDSLSVIRNGVVRPQDYDKIPKSIQWRIPPRGDKLLKQDLMIMDMVITNARQGWKRPIYFATSVPPESFVGLSDYLQQEGLAYRVVPIIQTRRHTSAGSYGWVATDIMYENLMKKFRFRNLNKPGIFYTADIRRMINNYRFIYYRLATAFAQEAQWAKDDAARLRAQLQKAVSEIEREQLQDKIDSLNQKAKEYLEKGMQVMQRIDSMIPDTAVFKDAYILTYELTVYSSLRAPVTLLEELAQKAKKRLLEEFTYYHKIGHPERINSFNINAAMILVQFFDRDLGKIKEAHEFAQKCYELTAKEEFASISQRLQDRLRFQEKLDSVRKAMEKRQKDS